MTSSRAAGSPYVPGCTAATDPSPASSSSASPVARVPTVTELTDEELTDQITTWAGRIAAGEAQLLALIGEFDRRGAWAGPGLLSCAHWLSWRLGMSPGAARERVRVARCLSGLPALARTFGSGKLSWTQVRAITRVASADDEQQWVEWARHATGAQLERLVRGVRRARKPLEDAADPELAAWRLKATVHYDEDGTMVLTVRAPAEQGQVVLAALEQAQAQLDAEAADASPDSVPAATPDSSAQDPVQDVPAATPDSSAEDLVQHVPAATPDSSAEDLVQHVPAGKPATLGDALLRLAQTALDQAGSAVTASSRRRRRRLTLQVDPISGWARTADGELLPPTSLAQVLRSLPGRERLTGELRRLTPEDLTVHDLGRTSRLPSAALRELLGVLDGERCRFPGCTRHRRLQAHHVLWWSDGGATDLANLILLCGRHHTLVHGVGAGAGLLLALAADRSLRVTTSDGVPVLHKPDLPEGDARELDPELLLGPEQLTPEAVTRLDLSYAVSVVLQQAA